MNPTGVKANKHTEQHVSTTIHFEIERDLLATQSCARSNSSMMGGVKFLNVEPSFPNAFKIAEKPEAKETWNFREETSSKEKTTKRTNEKRVEQNTAGDGGDGKAKPQRKEPENEGNCPRTQERRSKTEAGEAKKGEGERRESQECGAEQGQQPTQSESIMRTPIKENSHLKYFKAKQNIALDKPEETPLKMQSLDGCAMLPNVAYINEKYTSKIVDLNQVAHKTSAHQKDSLVFSGFKNKAKASKLMKHFIKGIRKTSFKKSAKMRVSNEKIKKSLNSMKNGKRSFSGVGMKKLKSRIKKMSPSKHKSYISVDGSRLKRMHNSSENFLKLKGNRSFSSIHQKKMELIDCLDHRMSQSTGKENANCLEPLSGFMIGQANIKDLKEHRDSIIQNTSLESKLKLETPLLPEETVDKVKLTGQGIVRSEKQFIKPSGLVQGKVDSSQPEELRRIKSGKEKVKKNIKKIKVKNVVRSKIGSRGQLRKKNPEKTKNIMRFKFPNYSEVAKYVERIPMLTWDSIDPYHEQKLKDKYVCSSSKMITPSVFWFLVCIGNFRKEFWNQSLIRTITHSSNFLTREAQFRPLSLQTPNLYKEKTGERQKIETLMLWDMMFLRKSPLLTETDYKSLSRFYRSLKKCKRLGRRFLFGQGPSLTIPAVALKTSPEMFVECSTLKDQEERVARVIKNFKVKSSSKYGDDKITLEDQISVLQTRNNLFQFFKENIRPAVKEDNTLLQMNGPLLLEKSKAESCSDLLGQVRVTEIGTIVKALTTMRKQNFKSIFSSIDKIKLRIQDAYAGSKILIENHKISLQENNPEELLKDMVTLSKQEQQYLIYKEKKQKMRKLQDVSVYRQAPNSSVQVVKMQHTDSICQVCTSGDYSDSNQIVFCSKCNVSVHQLCYGLSQIPEGDWICQVCLNFGTQGKYLDCALCSCKGGAMKEVNVMVFDDFVKTNFPVFWERQKQKIGRRREKARGGSRLGGEAQQEKPDQVLPVELPPPDTPSPKIVEESGETETEMVARVTQTYQWDVESHKGLFFDFYKERFNFSEEELAANEPLSLKCWIHLSCGLWMPEIFLRDLLNVKLPNTKSKVKKKKPAVRRRKERLVEIACKPKQKTVIPDMRKHLSHLNLGQYQLTGLKDVARKSLNHECQACKQQEGATLKCQISDCAQRFHVECSKRAGLTIEAQNSEHKDFVLFCEAHTPLRFKKEIDIMQKRSRNEIIKFAKNLKKKLKDVLSRETMTILAKSSGVEEQAVLMRPVAEHKEPKFKVKELKPEKKKKLKKKKVKKEKKEKREKKEKKEKKEKEKKEKYNLDEKIVTLSLENKNLLLQIKNEFQANKDFFFIWDVNLAAAPVEEGHIHERIRVSIPKKSIYKNKILKSNQIWKSLSKINTKSARSLYDRHLSIVTSLKYKPSKSQISEGDSEQDLTVTFIKNPERLDDKLYCICKQKWDGKLMIECELCDNWYHPECIGINEKDDVKLNLMYIVCSICRVSNAEYQDIPGHGHDALIMSKNPQDPMGHQLKVHGCLGPPRIQPKNLTSVAMLSSQNNLELVQPGESEIQGEPEENQGDSSMKVNMTHNKGGHVFRISLNQSKNKELLLEGEEEKEGEKEGEREMEEESKGPALTSQNRDFQIVEPFSEFQCPPTRVKVNTTEELAKRQVERVNRIYSRFYPTDADKNSLKRLLDLMGQNKEPLLSKREFEGKCLKANSCVEPPNVRENLITIKRIKEQ